MFRVFPEALDPCSTCFTLSCSSLCNTYHCRRLCPFLDAGHFSLVGGSSAFLAIVVRGCGCQWRVVSSSVGTQHSWVGRGYPGHSIVMGGSCCCQWGLLSSMGVVIVHGRSMFVVGVIHGRSRFVGGVAAINEGVGYVVSRLWGVMVIHGGLCSSVCEQSRLSGWVVIVVCGQWWLCVWGSCSFGCGRMSAAGPCS